MNDTKEYINVAVPRQLERRVKLLALENDTTIKSVVEIALEFYLNHVDKNKEA